MKDVKTWKLETRYYALSYINSLVNTHEWLKWAKDIKSYLDINLSHDKQKQKYLDSEIEQLNIQLWEAKQKQDKTRIEKLNTEIQKLNEQKEKKDFSWEVFNSWKVDIPKNERKVA